MRKWRRALLPAFAGLALAIASPDPGTGAAWRTVRPDRSPSFPEAHWAQPGFKTEWWYFTGHLESAGEPRRRFGYQFTFFRIGLLPEQSDLESDWAATDLIMGHAAISDLDTGRHRFSELVYRAVPMLGGFNPYPEPVIGWSRAPAGTDGLWTLTWNGDAFDLAMTDDAGGFGMRLSTRPGKPPVLQGPGGYSRKADEPGRASRYHSFTRLQTEGVLSLDGEDLSVQGESWMDKESGSSQLAEHQVGWDWFGLQLDDGRELMLYLLRDATGATDFAGGTVIAPSGETRYLEREDLAVDVGTTWTSPETGATYPAAWRVTVPSAELRLDVRPEIADQENRGRLSGGLFYWEGAVEVRDPEGAPVGRGYVELTGYGTDNRPAI